jgi:hypothetical protein
MPTPSIESFWRSSRWEGYMNSQSLRLRPNKRVKLAARLLRGTIPVVRQHSSVNNAIIGAPGRAGRRR